MAVTESATRQVLISASLILPTFVLYYLAVHHGPSTEWGIWACFLVGYLYCSVVIDLRGHTAARSGTALALALVVTAANRTILAPGDPTGLRDKLTSSGLWQTISSSGLSIFDALGIPSALLLAVAWSIARRNHPLWLVGLVPGTMIAGLALWAAHHLQPGDVGGPLWLIRWMLEPGVFVAGCLLCWLLDAFGTTGA